MSILLDCREGKYSKSPKYATELHLTGTTWNFTLLKQNENKKVICEPKDCYFQLRYHHAGKPVKGQANLPRDDWISILDSPKFQEFYKEHWNYVPLPTWYSTPRIEEYNLAKSKLEEGIDETD